MRSLCGSIRSTTSEKEICKHNSGKCSPESGIFNTHSENYSSYDICKTNSSRYSSSHSPLGDLSTSPDLYSISSSNTSSSSTIPTHQFEERDANNRSRFWNYFIHKYCHVIIIWLSKYINERLLKDIINNASEYS